MPSTIRDRFLEEKDLTTRYLTLVQRRLQVRVSHYNRFVRAARDYNVGDGLREIFSSDKPILDQDLQDAATKCQVLRAKIKPQLDAIIAQVDAIPDDTFPNGGIEAQSVEGEIIQWFLDGMVASDVEASRADFPAIKEDFLRVERESGGGYLDDPEELDELIERNYRRAALLVLEKEWDAITELYDLSEHIDIAAKARDPRGQVGLYRQAFLLLTTAFDAAVFDLVRMALKADFIGLVPVLAGAEKVDFTKFSDFSSMADWQEWIGEKQLKRRYLKDLLLMLNRKGVALSNTAQGHTFAHVMELVLRRNVHVHNRGIVDAHYTDANDDGRGSFNVYNLSPGDTADIDEAYWQQACQLTEFAIQAIADWVSSLTP